MVLSDGSVHALPLGLPLGLMNSATEFLLKLQKSDFYHGYSDDLGILYFFESTLRKSITQYHPSFNKLGHQIVQVIGRDICELLNCDKSSANQFQKSVFKGDTLWFYGGFLSKKDVAFWEVKFEKTSILWSNEKKSFFLGPQIEDLIGITSCEAIVNRTHILILGSHNKMDTMEYIQHTFLMEFSTRTLRTLPDINYLEGAYDYCTASVVHESKRSDEM